MTHRLRRLATATALLAVLTPAVAHAAADPVIKDCTDDGKLAKTYTQKQYAKALKNIPTDVDEYTDCRDVISRARLSHAGGGGSDSSSGGSNGTGGGSTGGGDSGTSGGSATAGTADEALQSATPDERAAVDAARTAGASTPVQVGDTSLTPEDLTRTDLGSVSSVPTPLLIVLILLALASVTGAGSAIMSRVRTARRTPGA